MQVYHNDPDYVAAMGDYLSGDWRAAESAFESLDGKYPREASIKAIRGNIAYSLGKLEESVELYQGAIEIAPQIGSNYYKLGTCLYRMGHLDRALKAFNSVIELKSQSHAMAGYFVGMINLFLGRDEEADAAFSTFHEQSPESRIADFYLAQLYIKRKNYSGALKLLSELAKQTPEFAEVHYMLGTVHFGLHNNAEAIKCFQRALEINPEDARSKSKLSLLTEVQWP